MASRLGGGAANRGAASHHIRRLCASFFIFFMFSFAGTRAELIKSQHKNLHKPSMGQREEGGTVLFLRAAELRHSGVELRFLFPQPPFWNEKRPTKRKKNGSRTTSVAAYQACHPPHIHCPALYIQIARPLIVSFSWLEIGRPGDAWHTL